jgi:hypothetical protein
LVFATPGIISKRKEFNLWLDQIEKIRVKTLNPIAVIKQNKHKFVEMEQQGIKYYPPFFIDKTTNIDLKNSCHCIGTPGSY